MATIKVSKRECAFMKIPLEIRLMIYRPLLVSKYTMKEHDMNSKEFDRNRLEILRGPDQTYDFDTAILGTNHEINKEAKDLCRRENNFVCLISQNCSHLGHEFAESGLQPVAKGPKAHGFWNVSMTLTLDFPTIYKRNCRGWTCPPEDGKPWNYIFCSSQLPELCRLLLERNAAIHGQPTLHIKIDSTVQTGLVTETESTTCGLSRSDQLLDPLRQLHSFRVVHIQGPLGDRYKNELIASICKECPTPQAVIQLSMLTLDRADEKVSRGHFTKANLLYKAALSSIRSCRRNFRQKITVMAEGPFPGLTAWQNISNIVVRLQGRIASVYFQTGQLRMARIYTERALDPRRPVDHRYHKEDSISVDEWEGVVYAEVLHVAAKISYANHNIDEALYALRQAEECAPFDEEQKCQDEVWKGQSMRLDTKREKRYEQRKEAKEIRSRKENEKIAGLFMVSCNRKDRGDRLLQSGRPDLAALTYTNALHKINSLRQYWLEQVEVKTRRSYYMTARNSLSFLITSGPFKDLSAKCATKALRFKVRASMAVAYSRSGRYTDVISVAEAADCNGRNRNCCYYHTCDCHQPEDCFLRSDGWDWEEDLKSDYAGIYYHKALALEKMGDVSGAIVDMEKALEHDPKSDVALAELSRLRRKLEEKAAHDSRMQEKLNIRRAETENKRELKARELRHKKATQINILQDRLRKKQIRRRENA